MRMVDETMYQRAFRIVGAPPYNRAYLSLPEAESGAGDLVAEATRRGSLLGYDAQSPARVAAFLVEMRNSPEWGASRLGDKAFFEKLWILTSYLAVSYYRNSRPEWRSVGGAPYIDLVYCFDIRGQILPPHKCIHIGMFEVAAWIWDRAVSGVDYDWNKQLRGLARRHPRADTQRQ